MASPIFTDDDLPDLAGILLDAALADGELAQDEVEAVTGVLREIAGGALPPPVLAALKGYDPLSFDLAAAVRAVDLGGRRRRRELLALVGMVVAADGVVTAAEEAWIGRLGDALGQSEEQIEELRDELRELVGAG
ncbi:MAG: TerB family tellurite resistance protein [Deltaproteobacteria bacterium]|nr:TerB family tellurite resistance protein [Deltaproteobacteria bacterium]